VAFDDLFSTQARAYAAFRPRYPEALYEWLASIVAARSRALDCGAGSGQAAIALAQHFEEVIAVEPSAAQLANAEQHPRVRYVQAPAESTGIEQGTVDLVTCANAIHWFDLDRFYDEVRRVATQGGVIAAWCYQRSAIEPTIDELLWRYASETLSGMWSEKIRFVNSHYASLPFPFEEIPAPAFAHEAMLTVDGMIGYLASWSATQTYIREKGVDPLVALRVDLAPLWGERERTVRWPVYLRVGHIDR
jgi:SAM-dependent methyltransferase